MSGGRNQLLLSTGQPAAARNLSVEQTVTLINDNPVVRFTLDVYPPNGKAFEAHAEKLVPLVQIP